MARQNRRESWQAFHDEEGKPVRVAALAETSLNVCEPGELRAPSGQLLRLQGRKARRSQRTCTTPPAKNLVCSGNHLESAACGSSFVQQES